MEIDEQIVKDWLSKLHEWNNSRGEISKFMLSTGKRQEELTKILLELTKILTNLEPRQVLSQLPSVPKLLQALLNNVTIQTTESLYQLVMKCITAVPISSESHSEKQNEITNKSVKWVKSQLKHTCTWMPVPIDDLLGVSDCLGLQQTELTDELNKEMVLSLVKDINNVSSREWNIHNRDFTPTCPLQGTTLRNISNICLSIASRPVARPLVDALLSCHVGSDVMCKSTLPSGCVIEIKEALSPEFLEALNDHPKKWYRCLAEGTPFSYQTRLGLWMNNDTYFDDEILDLLEVVCQEKTFISKNELLTLVSLRDLPKALSENISLFSIGFALLDRIIYETKGSFHVMKFWGTLLENMNKHLRQKKSDFIWNHNYAAIWSGQLSNFVSILNIEWLDLPKDAFLQHIKNIEFYIEKICEAQPRCDSYFVWLILQGFSTLVNKCCWAMLLGSEEFVRPCLAIQFWYFGGGTKLKEHDKIRKLVYHLRRLIKEHDINLNDILSAVNPLKNDIDQQTGYLLIRNLLMVFIFTNHSSRDLQDILPKLTEDLPHYYAIDFLLHWFEEISSIQTRSKMEWPYNKHYFDDISQYITFLRNTYEQLDTFPNKQDNNYETAVVSDLRKRFETILGYQPQQSEDLEILERHSHSNFFPS